MRDVERSRAFYREILGAFGLEEVHRYPSYRGTEEVVYVRAGAQLLGFRPADGGAHSYYDVGVRIDCPPEEDRDVPGYRAIFSFDPDGFRIEVVHWPGDLWPGRSAVEVVL